MQNKRKRKQVRSESDGSGQPAPAHEQSSISPQTKLVLTGYLLTRAEVARRLGTCTHTVQRLTRRGLLPAIVFNRRLIRYQPEAVEAFIQSALTGNGGAK